ncbi:MAG: branched-chain amino acid transaminase [Nitrospirae bacterium]|nr:branched-chain amino acid transaminase [Nitrospirota bacterium]
MLKETSKIWMDGKFVDWKDAKIHVLTHTLHYGLGVFEGIRCYKRGDGSVIFRLKEHVDRLFSSAHICHMKIPFTREEIQEAIKETVRINKLEECYIRPIAYIGYGDMGLFVKSNPICVAVAAWPWGTYLGEEGIKKGIRAKVSSINRHHVNISMTRAKVCGYYVNSQLAKREVVTDGYDEAIMLDTDGYVSEGPGENIFIVRNNVLKTTPLTSILEGITRDSIIQLAKEKGITVVEARFTRDELYIEITPIREIDNRQVGAGKPGPITTTLQSAFFDIVRGSDKKHKDWLAYI